MEYQQHLVADADRERRDLLEHLLAGELPTHRPLLAAAQAYGLTERSPALVASAMPVTPDADAPHVAAEALARAGGPTGRALVVRRQDELVVVAALRPADPAADAADVCDRLQETQRRLRIGGVPLAVGVGTVAAGIAELPRSYREASAALADVGVDGGVVALPRLSPFDYLALHADDTARRLVDPRLRGVPGGGPAARRRADRDRAGVRRRRPQPAGRRPSGCGCTRTRRSTGCAGSRSAPAATRAGSPTWSTCWSRSRSWTGPA